MTIKIWQSSTLPVQCQFSGLSVRLKRHSKQNNQSFNCAKMAFFLLNTEFDDWQKVLDSKKLYEDNSKTLLVIDRSTKLKGFGELKDRLIYERVLLKCKAGKERPCQSHGHRVSSTYKKNCPVKVSL